MQLGMVGLGRMGGNMARRLLAHGHGVVGFNREVERVAELEQHGGQGAQSLADLVQRLAAPRAIWIMLPAGAATETTIGQLAQLCTPGDVLIDGGNSNWHDDVRRAKELAARGLEYVDCGTSGGVWGFERGYCLMVGGSPRAVAHIEPVLRDLAPGRGDVAPAGPRTAQGSAAHGYLHCGPAGAGHFVKMVHNGIEYGVMQSYAEGFDLLANAAFEGLPKDHRFDIDLPAVAELWRRGSVIGSWLLDLTAAALDADPKLDGFEGRVPDSGEGRWTIQAALDSEVPVPLLAGSVFARFRSRRQPTFADKVLSAMRKQFGGHSERA